MKPSLDGAERSQRRRRQRRRRKTLQLLTLIAAISLTGCGHTAGQPASHSQTGHRSAKSDSIYAKLLLTPFAAKDLPTGITADPPLVESNPDPARGVIGAVGVKLRDTRPATGDFNVIVYGVFATDDAARQAFAVGPAAFLDPLDHKVTATRQSTSPFGPSQEADVKVTDMHGGSAVVAGYTYVTILRGSVLVTAGNGSRGPHSKGDPSLARSLAGNAMVHARDVGLP